MRKPGGRGTIFLKVLEQVITSILDPADRGVSAGEEGPFCNVCERHVHPGTKHCWQCNKCIEGFDHHCKWLNTCIGLSNYKPFFMLLWSALIFTGIVATSTLYAFTMLLREESKSRGKISDFINADVNVPVSGSNSRLVVNHHRERKKRARETQKNSLSIS